MVPPVNNHSAVVWSGLRWTALRISIIVPFARVSASNYTSYEPQTRESSSIEPDRPTNLTVTGDVVLHVVASSLSETGTKLDIESHTM